MYGINVYSVDGDRLNTDYLGNYLTIFRVVLQSELTWPNSTTLTSDEIAVTLLSTDTNHEISIYALYSDGDLANSEWRIRYETSDDIVTAYVRMVAKNSASRASNDTRFIFAITKFK